MNDRNTKTKQSKKRTLKLLFVGAHPDDESLGNGGMLAKYAAEGIETHLICATRGERGWFGPEDQNPGLSALGGIRETEMSNAAKTLQTSTLHFLDYIDGELDMAKPGKVIAEIAAILRKIQPDVVVTFGPDGIYGHPDHVAICQFTTASVAAAANPAFLPDKPVHAVSKLYYLATSMVQLAVYQKVFGDLIMNIDGAERRVVTMPDWLVTTRLETGKHIDMIKKAIACHETQVPAYENLQNMSEADNQTLWGQLLYYRVFSLVNGGRVVETDLFAGLR